MRESQELLETKLSIFSSIRKEKQKVCILNYHKLMAYALPSSASLHPAYESPARITKERFQTLENTIWFQHRFVSTELSQISHYNYEITGLRSQLKDLRETRHSHNAVSPLPSPTLLPDWIASSREIFRDAYVTLNTAFSCQDDKHSDHYAALETGIRGEGRQGTRLEFAIVHCQDTKYDACNRHRLYVLIGLVVVRNKHSSS